MAVCNLLGKALSIVYYSIVLFIPSQKNNQGSLPTKQLF